MNDLSLSFPLHEQREPTLTFLGLRSPIERAAEVERLCGYAPLQRGWWQQDARLEDCERLRKRLVERHVGSSARYSAKAGTLIWAGDLSDRQHRQHERIAKVCKWAMRRMKRADDAYAQGKLNLTPVRGETP